MKAWAKGLLGTLLVLAGVQWTGLGEGLNRWLTDTHWRWKASVLPAPFPRDIVVIGIDDRSTKELGRMRFWSRRRYADLLDRLRQARVVGLDLLFVDPDVTDPRGDAALAAAMERHGRVVTPLFTWKETRPVSAQTQAQEQALLARLPAGGAAGLPFVQSGVLEPPIPVILQATARVAAVDVSSDADGVYRRAILVRQTSEGKLLPHLTTAMAAVADSIPEAELYAGLPGRLRLQGRSLPLEGGTLQLEPLARRGGGYLPGVGQPVPLVSFSQALRSNPEEWKDRIVLVGETATGTTDIRPNLLDPGLRGVELNAAILANLLYLPPVTSLPLAAQWVLVLAAIGAPLWLYSALPAVKATLGALLAGGGLVGIMEAAFWFGRMLPEWAPVLVGLVGSTLLMGLQRLGQEQEQKRQIRDSFSLYVAPELVEEIVRDPARVRQEGERQRIAVLFSDIRGFTRYSEQNPPELVVHQMGEYFNEMTEAVLKSRGVLDKFIGDAVMSLYGPFYEGDASVSAKAVASALDMLDRLDALNRRWEQEGVPQFRIGIGIHVGEAVVGNIVTQHRQQFTALGDTVNLASRLQSATKELGATLIVSEDVRAEAEPLLSQWVEFTDRGMLSVRNREQPVRVYEVRRRPQVQEGSS